MAKDRNLDGSAKKRAEQLRLAERAYAMREYGLARDLAESILGSNPTHLGALELLANCLWKQSEFEQLVRTLDLTIPINPFESGYHSLKGSALEALGRYGEAMRAYARACDLSTAQDPRLQDSMENLREWQAALVADLVREDPVFAASFAQNPGTACRKRGFDFLPEYAGQGAIHGVTESLYFPDLKPSSS